MPISIEDVEKVASLAKLDFSNKGKNKLVKELNNIVTYVQKLNELDTNDVEPTSHIIELKNVMRDDKVELWLSQEKALENAPAQMDGFFSVPKVIK